MKKMRKIVSLVLAMVMVLAMAMTTFAAQGTNDDSGSITIENAIAGQTYKAYQILYLESYNTESGAYSYKANSEWAAWLATQTDYVAIDAQGYVTWVEDADAAEFAKAALGQLAGKTAVSKTANDETVEFTGLNLGYYLVDTTLGTLCALDNTNSDFRAHEKNVEPTVKKEVLEDSTDSYGETNDAELGELVTYQTTITAGNGAQNYVLHDTMTGLTFVEVKEITLNGSTVTAENNYTVTSEGLTDRCSFEVTFTQAFCDTLKTNDQIVVTYTATVNADAVIAGDGNPNETYLSYSETPNTNTLPDKTTTYVWEFDILKYTKEDEEEVALEDAHFVLYYEGAESSQQYAKITDGKLTGWTDIKEEATDLVSDADGKIYIDGLDSGTYYLEETAAPDGYNKLAAPIEVVIKSDGDVTDGTTIWADKLVKVENKAGTLLPSTGGMGTTILYVAGGALVLLAVVLLFVKRRSSYEA